MAAPLPPVSVLVPAYRPSGMLVRTLQSVIAQTHPDVQVHLSMDFAPGHVAPELPVLAGLHVHRQPYRLGWVGNVNWLLQQVRTPFFVVLAHDDRLSPRFLEDAVEALRARPELIVVHGETRHYGVREGEVAFTPGIAGEPVQRILEFIRRRPHAAEMAWRGVTRSSAIASGLRLRARRSDGMFANTLWALELLAMGDSEGLRSICYEKFTHPTDGFSREFHRRTLPEKSEMLADNLACLVDVLDQHGIRGGPRVQIVAAYANWLLSFNGMWSVVGEAAGKPGITFREARPLLARFIANVIESARIG